MMIVEDIHQLLINKLEEESFRDCFLVAIELNGKNLSVFLDSDTAITFERCKAISRFLESHLDETKWLGEDYILEVSSAGLNRPLSHARQFIKNVGRGLNVILNDGSKLTGIIKSANSDQFELEWTEERRENKKKIKDLKIQIIEYKNIKEAKILIKI